MVQNQQRICFLCDCRAQGLSHHVTLWVLCVLSLRLDLLKIVPLWSWISPHPQGQNICHSLCGSATSNSLEEICPLFWKNCFTFLMPWAFPKTPNLPFFMVWWLVGHQEWGFFNPFRPEKWKFWSYIRWFFHNTYIFFHWPVLCRLASKQSGHAHSLCGIDSVNLYNSGWHISGPVCANFILGQIYTQHKKSF